MDKHVVLKANYILFSKRAQYMKNLQKTSQDLKAAVTEGTKLIFYNKYGHIHFGLCKYK